MHIFPTKGLKGLRDHRRKRGPFQKQECVSNTFTAFAVFALVTYAFLFIFLHAVFFLKLNFFLNSLVGPILADLEN